MTETPWRYMPRSKPVADIKDKLADYVDVAERIRLFIDRYPDGSLTQHAPPYFLTGGERLFIVYTAAAYRTPDDPRPGIGTAWEPVPGPTQFTRDSELMNAETAAWGRAIVALGIGAKRIASADEIRRAKGSVGEPQANPPAAGGSASQDAMPHGEPASPTEKLATEKQKKLIWATAKDNGFDEDGLRAIVLKWTGVDSTKQLPASAVDNILADLKLEEDVIA